MIYFKYYQIVTEKLLFHQKIFLIFISLSDIFRSYTCLTACSLPGSGVVVGASAPLPFYFPSIIPIGVFKFQPSPLFFP